VHVVSTISQGCEAKTKTNDRPFHPSLTLANAALKAALLGVGVPLSAETSEPGGTPESAPGPRGATAEIRMYGGACGRFSIVSPSDADISSKQKKTRFFFFFFFWVRFFSQGVSVSFDWDEQYLPTFRSSILIFKPPSTIFTMNARFPKLLTGIFFNF
jgi:hypothetical protein